MKILYDLIFFIFLLIFSCKSFPSSNLKHIHQAFVEKVSSVDSNPHFTINLENKMSDFYFKYGPCNAQNCPAPNGYCSSPNQCTCAQGYVNYESNNSVNIKNCQYVQKRQITAFFLELFLWCGAGHFYSGRILAGITKFIIAILFIVIYGFLKHYANKQNNNDIYQSVVDDSEGLSEQLEKLLGILFCLVCCGLIIWQIIDLVMYATNKYNDGNGVPLSNW